MTDLLDEKTINKFKSWDDLFEKIKQMFQEFSESITKYDREKDDEEKVQLRDEITELYNLLSELYEKLDEEISDDFDKMIYDAELRFEKLKKLYNDAKNKGYLDKGAKPGKAEHDELKKIFKYGENISIEELKNSMIHDLNEINKFIKNSKDKFKVDGTVANFSSKINERTAQFSKMLDTPPSTPMLTPSKKTKKGKGPDFEPMPLPMKLEDKKEIEKIIEDPQMKSQIIDKIMKAFPTFKKDQLDALSVKDLLEISITLGFDFSKLTDFNRLKASNNASKEVKELAQNLENLKREREIQKEFKRLQNRVQDEEAITAKEKKDKLMKNAANIIKEKLRNKKGTKKPKKRKGFDIRPK